MLVLVPFLYQESVQSPPRTLLISPMNKEQHTYWRSDITGLRALAVLPVLFFHAWPTLFPGGFVGVDIFFVISGYLISGILFRQLLRTGRIDFVDFYEKRVRRIIPNLLGVLLFVGVVGWFFLTPREFYGLGKQIYSSAFFYQNFRLLDVLGDYFAEDATREPLLHLWSLAIEEQFYIFFPLVCALIWRLRANVRLLGMSIAAITAGSFLACLVTIDQAFRFYFPLTRFWELGVGILLSFAQHFGRWGFNSQSSLKGNVLSLMGVGLIVSSFFLVREKDFPGPEALMPTLGAVLVIAASPKSYINRFLSAKPLVFIGLISYSLYLWHWPLLAYANIILPAHETWVNGCLLLLSLILSVFAYRCLETPFRTVQEPKIKRKSVVILGICLLLVTGVGQAIKRDNGVPSRNSRFFQYVLDIREDWTTRENLHKLEIDGVTLEVNREDVFPQLLFVGDSHMEQYIDRITQLAHERNVAVAFLVEGGCSIAPGVISREEVCERKNRTFEKLLRDPRLKHVIFSQKWGQYETSSKFSVVNALGKEVRFDQGGWMVALQNMRKAFETSDRSLHVILDVPYDESKTHSNYDPIFHLNRYRVGELNTADFMVALPEDKTWLRGNEVVKSVFSDVATIIAPAKQHCPNDMCNLLHYKDDDHLRASYARDHAVWIDSIFDDVKGVIDESKNS